MIDSSRMRIPYRSGMDGDRAGALGTALAPPQVQTSAPTERGGQSLADQIRASWGGNWDEAGIDRAKELADLLGTKGITSLGDLSLINGVNEVRPGGYYENGQGFSGPERQGREWISDPNLVQQNPYQRLKIGDKEIGFLGDYNNDGTFGSNSSSDLRKQFGDENTAGVGWSARGHGNVAYNTGINQRTGKLEIRPSWGSSSDTSLGRDLIKDAVAVYSPFIAPGLSNAIGSVGSGALIGGVNGGLQGGDLKSALKGAALGGAGAYAGGLAGDYLAPGTSVGNGSFLGEGFASGVPAWDAAAANAGLGLGEGAGALGSVAANTAPQLTPAALESLIGTPGYGYNAAAEIAGSGIPGYAGSGANALMGFDNIANPGLWDGSAVLSPADQSATIIGQRPLTSIPSLPPSAGITALPAISESLPSQANDPNVDYSNEGRNYPTQESTQGPGGSPVNSSPNAPWYDRLGNNLKNAGGNWFDRLIKLDPTAIQQGIGGLGALKSLFGGNDGPSARVFPGQGGGGGAGGGASNDNWTSAQQPNVQKYFDRQPQPFSWTPRPQGYASGGSVHGHGSGQDDVVPINAAPGEYIFDADSVSALGDGSSEAGVRMLDELRQKLRQHKRSGPTDEIPPRAKSPLEYLE